MSVRISKRDLKAIESRVNSRLKKIELRVSYRYGYVAIDIYRDGVNCDTLIAGLTNKEAFNILECIERVLMLEEIG